MNVRTILFAFVATGMCSVGFAGDWNQWRGPHRDDLSRESGLLKKWPDGGPKQLWVYNQAGIGYAGPAIVADRLYIMAFKDGREMLLKLDATTGKEIWSAPFGELFENKWGDGPRSTPTVVDGNVYCMGAQGILACIDAESGKVSWTRKMSEFGGKVPGWGYTESPLVVDGHVFCTPGESQGAIVALKSKDGALVWQSHKLKDGAQYSSLIPATIQGKPQVVQLFQQSLAGVDIRTGDLLWRHEFPGRTAVIPTPIVKGNQVYVTAGYGIGCTLIEIQPDQSPKEIYFNKVMKNHHGGVILKDGFLYGHSDKVGWVCQNFATGEEVWSEKEQLGKGAIGYADGHFYCLDEKTGEVALIRATPERWDEVSRFTLEPQTKNRKPDGRIWVHPVICNGRLYLRDQEFVHCYQVK